MNRKIPMQKAFALLFMCAALFSFAACSQAADGAQCSSVSFTIDSALASKLNGSQIQPVKAQGLDSAVLRRDQYYRAAIQASRPFTDDEAAGLFMEIALQGGVSQSKTIPVLEGETARFDNVPTGVSVWAEASVYKKEAGKKIVCYSGKSSSIVVHDGKNALDLALKAGPGAPDLKTRLFVSASGDDSNAGTYLKPLKTIQAAVNKMDDASKGWTIVVDGTLSGAQTIKAPSGGTIAAASITLLGSGKDAVLDGGFTESAKGRVLAIQTPASVPVTIKSLKITGGYASAHGGAISAGTDNGSIATKIILSDGVEIYSCQASCGGGIYVQKNAEVQMKGNCSIKNCKAYGNSGGAVYVAGGTFVASDNASIDSCQSGSNGGGIAISTGSACLEGSASITGCSAISADSLGGRGGGVYVSNSSLMSGDGLFTMKGSSVISGCSVGTGSSDNGGAVYVNKTISTGTSSVVLGEATFDMQGGTIKGGSATKGSGVYVTGAARLKMGGTARVLDDCDIFLGELSGQSAKITVTSAFASYPVATITPYSYEENRIILALEDGVDSALCSEFAKFKVTTQTDSLLPAPQKWMVDAGGLLQMYVAPTAGVTITVNTGASDIGVAINAYNAEKPQGSFDGSTPIVVQSHMSEIVFAAQEGFASYVWKIDNQVVEPETLVVPFQLNLDHINSSEFWPAGVYDIELEAFDADGNAYSFSAQVKVE